MESMTLRQRVGINVRRLRTEQKITAEDLARNMKGQGFAWSNSRVSELEKGNKAVSLAELIALAYSLGGGGADVRLTDFFQGEGPVELTEAMDITTAHMLEIFTGAPIGQDVSNFPRLQGEVRAFAAAAGPSVSGMIASVERFNPNAGKLKRNALRAARESAGLAEVKAAKVLGINENELLGACLALWGKSLTAERDARSEGLRGQAKGHVTRQLLAELREHIGKFNGND